MWSEEAMTRRLRWEKLRWESRLRHSLVEERDFMDKDLAASWLRRREKWRVEQSLLRRRKKSRRGHQL